MRKAIIVWGGWAGHEPEQGAAIVGDMLARDGFDVHITDDLAVFASSRLSETSLLVPIITGETIDKAATANLTRAVRGGMGLASFHCGMATSFKDNSAFHYLAGVTWVSHPGDIVDYRVNITRPDDPVMAGIADFDYRSEQYYLHFDPSVEMLATTTFSGEHDEVTRDIVMPVAFKRHFGKGRIFYSALGHVAAEFDHPVMPTILRRGLDWAARRDETESDAVSQ